MQYRSLNTTVEPATAPVTLAEAKAHLRVDVSTDDTYISALVNAATEYAETYTNECFVHRKLRMRMDFFPTEIELPRPPMATAGTTTVVTITYTLANGSTTTLAESRYRVDRDSTPGVLRFNYGGSWPEHLSDYNAVTVDWWAGRGADGAATSQRVKNAILWIVGLWYERRMAADNLQANEIPFGVKALLDSAKWGAYG